MTKRLMEYLKGFALFWYDFVVGDDWRVAVIVAAVLAGTWLLAHHGMNWFWLLPVAVLGALALSLRRATRS